MFNKNLLLALAELPVHSINFGQIQMPILVKDKVLKSINGRKQTGAEAFKRAAAKKRNIKKRKSNRK